MSKLNIALIGAGRRGGGAHLPVIAKLTDVYNLVAICDMDEATANNMAERYGANAYTNIRELVKHEQLDVADITVPGSAHHAIACFLADAGVNIVCETPIAATLPLSDMMIEAAEKNNVKLEVAENYYRAPRERFISKVIEANAIGKVSRIYRIFYEGGYHGMSMLRIRAGGNPVSILGISQSSEVIPIIDRMKRHHTSERWTLGFLDFDSGATALMTYSNVIHARSLGRGQNGISQIDGSAGTIIGETIHVVSSEELKNGARSKPYSPQRTTIDVNGTKVLEKIFVELPEQTIVWENPLKDYPLSEGQIAVADELLSIANAVLEDKEPEYGALAGRLDQEMNLAMSESALRSRETINFPITSLTQTEKNIHERIKSEFGCEPEDVEKLVDTFFPRR